MATSYIQTNNRGSVSVTADGVKTYAQLFNELAGLADYSKFSPNATLTIGSGIWNLNSLSNGYYYFSTSGLSGGNMETDVVELTSASVSACHFYNTVIQSNSNVTFTDYSNSVLPAGTVLKIHY